eukprot:TRINITY_DN15001_c0_g1_i1.p1 TRINITY_DN15001_c0_g1~~TRINITY_DN15001_c0_g1_i1.p1  ORF type:complete len:610 (+),score=163.13 TRINITY_DN15001_c0_g1_i1:883-2712(+)
MIRKEWADEKALREKREAELKEAQRNSTAGSKKLQESSDRHVRDMSRLKKELERIDSYLAEEGVEKGGDRVDALRRIRDEEIKILDSANRSREAAMDACSASQNELKKLQSELVWLRRSPFIVCSIRPEVHSRDKTQHAMTCSIIDVSPEVPSQRIEVRLPGRSQSYRFDTVLPPWSSTIDQAASLNDITSAAFSGIYTAVLHVSSHSLVAASRTAPIIQSIAKELYAAASRATSIDSWEWKIQLSCIELRNDITRDLLNTDRDYIRNQKMGGSIAIRHPIKKDKGHVFASDCAAPVVKDIATMQKLLDIAISSRSVSPEGELRGHVAYMFNVTGSKHKMYTTSGSLMVIDLATDCDLPVELPPGSGTEDALVVQTSVEERAREREYVRKSLAQLNMMLDMYQGNNKFSAEDERRCPSASPLRAQRQTEFYVGQEVEIVGLQAADFIHLNGTRGVVMGKGEGDVADRVLVEFASDYTLPFLPKNLMPLKRGRSASPSAASPHRVTFDMSPKRSPSSSQETKRSRSKSAAAHDPHKPNFTKAKLNTLLAPCFEGGILGVMLSLPAQGTEQSGMSALRLCTRISKCQMGQLLSNPAGSEKPPRPTFSVGGL